MRKELSRKEEIHRDGKMVGVRFETPRKANDQKRCHERKATSQQRRNDPGRAVEQLDRQSIR
jgi:hypothetical protein